MRTLVAFDKFKDSLSAVQACEIVAGTLRTRHPDWELERCPLTDGGEGFATILTRAAAGELRTARVTGPRGAAVDAVFGLVRLDRLPPAARSRLDLPENVSVDALVAVIEMAAASGLALLPAAERDPWQTSSVGTGQLIVAAMAAGAAVVLLGVGGSATSDLGLGALSALGLNYATDSGAALAPIPAVWDRLARIGGAVRADLPPVRIACDVANPLLGPRGAAAVYGPQKGLRAEEIARFDASAARVASMLAAHAGTSPDLVDAPGAGAAGGIAFGLMAAASARLLPGYDLVRAWLDLDARIATADLVLTGEGRFDASSLDGKGPGAIAAQAAALGKRVLVLAGAVTTTAPLPFAAHAITPPDMALPAALWAAPELLALAVERHLG